ncbi:MAG: hypothetical protein WDA14_11595 [Sphaerochaetaceae bacterium]|jgi:hypothetical protein
MNPIEPQFSSYYALLKHFQRSEYAEQFLQGKLYLNSLDHFRSISIAASKGKGDKQSDLFEGSVPIEKESISEKVYLAAPYVYRESVFDPVFIFDEYKYSHLLCFSTIDFHANSISTINPLSMKEFGPHLVLIFDKAAFRERVFKALSALPGISYLCGRIQYRRPTLNGKLAKPVHSLSVSPDIVLNYHEVTCAESPIRDCFNKSYSYSHQREWRLWLYQKNWDTNPFTLEVGDLHDIATRVTFENLAEKIQDLDSRSKLPFQEESYGLMYGNIPRKSLQKQIIEHNSSGRLAFHIG